MDEGEIVTLIGANGAGKTTTLNTISGILRPRSGEVSFDGRDLTDGARTRDRGAWASSRSPEGRRIFARLTVDENLRMGAYSVRQAPWRAGIERVFTMFPRLKERAGQVAGTLSGGEQQMLAIGRALMATPRILLLDEPSHGPRPDPGRTHLRDRRGHPRAGTTILLVEQNASQALAIADRGYVLQTGRIVLADSAAALAANEDVRRSYLGE